MSVKTAVRILELIELFAREQRPLTLSDISELLDVPASSTHGLVKTLLMRGYLYEISRRNGYYFTKKLAFNVGLIADSAPLLNVFEPILKEIKIITDETVVLSKRQGDSIVYLDVFESERNVRFTPTVGQVKPMYSTASGKALLGELPEREFLKFASSLSIKSFTEKTIKNKRQLIDEVSSARSSGWYLNIEQNTEGLVSIAVPVSVDSETYAVAVGGPESRMLLNQEKIVSALIDARTKINAISET